MEKQFRASRRQNQGERKDGIEFANQEQFLNILGPPGSGKTTFLRRLGQEALLVHDGGQANEFVSTNYRHARLPVLIELRRFRDKEVDLIARIADEFNVCGFPKGETFVEEALNEGRLLVLLDGLDEVPERQLETVVKTISDFVDRYRATGNRFVTSCRTAHYKNFMKKFTDVVLSEFDDEQIRKFAEGWFSSLDAKQAKVSEKFVFQLETSDNVGTMELARTPLLLTFLCMTFQRAQDLPRTQAKLYQRALEILVREWPAERFVHSSITEDIHGDLELDMLAEMAAVLFQKDQFFFTRKEVISGIEQFIRNVLDAPPTVDADSILTAIEEQQGLIVQRADDVYSFSHLTIQEYLTARYAYPQGPWAQWVDTHLFDERWGVVFTLMSGNGRADELLIRMAKRVHAEIDEDLRVNWAAAMDGPPSIDEPEVGAEKRLVGAIWVGGAIFPSSGSQLHEKIKHLCQRGVKLSSLLDIAISDMVAIQGSSLHDIEPGAHPQHVKGYTEWENLIRILSGYRVIARCREASHFITAKVWEDVCDSMLSHPDAPAVTFERGEPV